MNNNTNNTNAIVNDVDAWRNAALALSQGLSNQTELVNILNSKIKELTEKCEKLEKENKELLLSSKNIMNDNNKVQMKVEENETEEVMTKVTFRNFHYFCDDILFIDGEIKLQDLPNEMKRIFEGKCTTHFAKCEPVIHDCLVEIGDKGSYIEIEILNSNYGKTHTIKDFIDTYNSFIKTCMN